MESLKMGKLRPKVERKVFLNCDPLKCLGTLREKKLACTKRHIKLLDYDLNAKDSKNLSDKAEEMKSFTNYGT